MPDGISLAAVARILEEADGWVLLRILADAIGCTIARAVIHNYNFNELITVVDEIEDRVEGGRKPFLLVVSGDHDRERVQLQIISWAAV
jgi:hypothetical protein